MTIGCGSSTQKKQTFFLKKTALCCSRLLIKFVRIPLGFIYDLWAFLEMQIIPEATFCFAACQVPMHYFNKIKKQGGQGI